MSQTNANFAPSLKYEHPDQVLKRMRAEPRRAATIAPDFVSALLGHVGNLPVFKGRGGTVDATYPMGHGSSIVVLTFTLGTQSSSLEYNISLGELQKDDMFSSESPSEMTHIIRDMLSSLIWSAD